MRIEARCLLREKRDAERRYPEPSMAIKPATVYVTLAGRPMSASRYMLTISSYLRDKSNEIEQAGCFLSEVVDRLREETMFRLMMPKDLSRPKLKHHRADRSGRRTLQGWSIGRMV